MKLQNNEIKSYSSCQRSTEYSIAQSAKMMKMLADSLYNDKIAAPIRELSTNAWDAHVMAGNTPKLRKQNPGDFEGGSSVPSVPHISLPTRSDLNFRIRDYGTGLSDEQLEKMYTIYGESNKNESNEYNGCMGIGSKSPFAYSLSFTTVSYFNGMKYVCVNSKNDAGIPNISLFHSEPTDEPNGLEVSFAVNYSDVDEFTQKANRILQWFPYPFHVTKDNIVHRIAKNTDYVYEGKDWKINTSGTTSYAIMGYVAYPIDTSHFYKQADPQQRRANVSRDWYQHYSDTPTVDTKYKDLLDLGMELHFDIGEVEMDISREGLQYNRFTINAIKAKLDRVFEEVKEKIDSEFKSCKNLWEARLKYQELIDGKFANAKKLFRMANSEFNGEPLNRRSVNVHAGLQVFKFVPWGAKPKRTHATDISVSRNVTFYIADLERGNYVAVERSIKPNDIIYLIKGSDADIKTFMNHIGYDSSKLIKCSSIPKPPKSARKKVEHVFVLDTTSPGSRWDKKSFWNNTDIDFGSGGVYIEINNWKCISQDTSHGPVSSDKLQWLVKSLTTLGIKVPEVYGIKTAVIKKYNKSSKWTDFFTWAKQQLVTYVQNCNEIKYLSDIQTLQDFSGEIRNKVVRVSELAKAQIHNPNNPVKKMIDKLNELGRIRDKWEKPLSNTLELCREFGIKQFANVKVSNELDKLAEEIKQKYEVFSLVREWNIGIIEADIIIRIINQYDKD